MSRIDPQALQKGQEGLNAVLTRSASDPEFRRKLVSDARGALGEHFGREMPESVNFVFVENQADATLVLPPVSEGELSDAELETVAGGWLILVALGFGLAALGDALN